MSWKHTHLGQRAHISMHMISFFVQQKKYPHKTKNNTQQYICQHYKQKERHQWQSIQKLYTSTTAEAYLQFLVTSGASERLPKSLEDRSYAGKSLCWFNVFCSQEMPCPPAVQLSWKQIQGHYCISCKRTSTTSQDFEGCVSKAALSSEKYQFILSPSTLNIQSSPPQPLQLLTPHSPWLWKCLGGKGSPSTWPPPPSC